MKVTALEVIAGSMVGMRRREREGETAGQLLLKSGSLLWTSGILSFCGPAGRLCSTCFRIDPKALRMSLLSLSCSWAVCSPLSPAVPTQGPCLPPVGSLRAQEGLAGGREGGSAGAVGRALHPHPPAGPGLLLPTRWSPPPLLRTLGWGGLCSPHPLWAGSAN